MVSWSQVRAVCSYQGAGVGLVFASIAFTPLGAGWAVAGTAAAIAIGAWWWVARQVDPVSHALVRAMARRIALVHGAVAGLAYAAIGSLPGQLELSAGGLALASVVMAVGGGATGAALTLCGLDVARHRTNLLTLDPR